MINCHEVPTAQPAPFIHLRRGGGGAGVGVFAGAGGLSDALYWMNGPVKTFPPRVIICTTQPGPKISNPYAQNPPNTPPSNSGSIQFSLFATLAFLAAA